jgi:hypothetical protein
MKKESVQDRSAKGVYVETQKVAALLESYFNHV